MRYQRARWLGLALGALLVLAACSARDGSEPVSVTTPYEQVTPIAGASSERLSAASTGKPAHNDLKKGHVTRSLKAGAVKVTVKYSLRNRVQEWSPGVGQPLTVSMTALAQMAPGSTECRPIEGSICRESPLTSMCQTPPDTWILQTLLSTRLTSHQASW